MGPVVRVEPVLHQVGLQAVRGCKLPFALWGVRSPGGYPPLPGRNPNIYNNLAAIYRAKYVQAKGLLLNMCRVTVYGQNAASNMENPADGRVFLISTIQYSA